MNPEEVRLLERTLKLAEENNEILRKINAHARRSTIYGFIKLVLIAAPLIWGYLYLEPYLDQAAGGYSQVREILNTLSR